MKSKGVIRGIIKEHGTLLVSFPNHDGYFRLPNFARMPELKNRIIKAQQDHEEISFTFDRDLNILEVSEASR